MVRDSRSKILHDTLRCAASIDAISSLTQHCCACDYWGYSSYVGGVFQGSPALLGLAKLSRALPADYEPACTAAVFIIADLAAALLLHYLTRTRLKSEPSAREAELESNMPAARKPALSRSLLLAPANLPDTAAAVYLLNPITAAQCAARSAEVLARLSLLAALCAAHHGAALAAAEAALGVSCVCFELHSFVLLPAVALLAAQTTAPTRTFTTFAYPAASSSTVLGAIAASEA
jgi:GPI transamidase subunit PIG-U